MVLLLAQLVNHIIFITMKRTFLTESMFVLLFSITTITGCRDSPLDWGHGGAKETCKDISIIAGVQDNFATNNDEPASPSTEMVAYMKYHYIEQTKIPRNQLTMRFDETSSDRAFGHTFRLPDENITKIKGATLTVHVKPFGGLSPNDEIQIIDAIHHDVKTPLWMRPLSMFNDGSWRSGSRTIVLDLANLPAHEGYATNVLDALKDGVISVYVQDDTSVDYAQLDVSYCTGEEDNNDGLF